MGTLAMIREESMNHTQVFKWKSPNSLRQKKARQATSKVKSILIIFFDISGIIHKEFILPSQTVHCTYYCDVLWGLCENV
jgi:hypothetical protein